MSEQRCEIKLPYLISDGMVLQRKETVRIWGWAAPMEQLTVEFLGIGYETTVKEDGCWEVSLQELDAGGPYEMSIRCDGTERLIKDILVGDVWVLGGQSNMELNVSRTFDRYEEEVLRDSDYPLIRRFNVPQIYHFHNPVDELSAGSWIPLVPETASQFSAVGYYFAKEIFNRYHIPIGLLHTAVGGTPAESWISEKSLMHFEGLQEILSQCKDDAYVQGTIKQDELKTISWNEELNQKDEGLKEGETPWYSPKLVDSSWNSLELPCNFEDTKLATFRGSVWFRREIIIPEELAGQEARLALGTIIDADETYVNAVAVGATGYRYPPRRYMIPAGVLKAGSNLIAVRVIVNQNTGAFITDMPYYLKVKDTSIPLSGTWNYRIGTTMPPLEPNVFFSYKPVGLYNGMIYPLRKYCIKGALWYQGESNTEKPVGYKDLFETVIRDWRNTWSVGDFPFYYVQLANFCPWRREPDLSNWALLRDEQRKAMETPNTGMVVTIDIGEYNDLHPKDKKTVGQRLARWVRKDVFGESIEACGPLLDYVRREEGSLLLYFSHLVEDLRIKGETLKGLTISSSDGVFHEARAVIEKDTVRVFVEDTTEQVVVRYAWSDSPDEANLYNSDGLPAVPFSVRL
jgi:sialate O-acetylesterase